MQLQTLKTSNPLESKARRRRTSSYRRRRYRTEAEEEPLPDELIQNDPVADELGPRRAKLDWTRWKLARVVFGRPLLVRSIIVLAVVVTALVLFFLVAVNPTWRESRVGERYEHQEYWVYLSSTTLKVFRDGYGWSLGVYDSRRRGEYEEVIQFCKENAINLRIPSFPLHPRAFNGSALKQIEFCKISEHLEPGKHDVASRLV